MGTRSRRSSGRDLTGRREGVSDAVRQATTGRAIRLFQDRKIDRNNLEEM